MRTLTRRRSRNYAQETWPIYYGDVYVSTVAEQAAPVTEDEMATLPAIWIQQRPSRSLNFSISKKKPPAMG